MVDRKPSRNEEEYFLRLETERIQKIRDQHQKQLAEEEKKRLKELHFMCCPKCGMRMTTSTMADVEIDVCPDCRGIFLDFGELDKILKGKRRERMTETMVSVRRMLRW